MTRVPFFWQFSLIILFFLSGCVREQVEDCSHYKLSIKVIDEEGNDITSSEVVTTTDVYLFDKSGFVRMLPMNSYAGFAHSNRSQAMIVGWGNASNDSLLLPQLTSGTSLEEARLQLVQKQDGYHLPVSDLFYGLKELNGTPEVTLVLSRAICGVSIRTQELAKHFGAVSPDAPYRLVVRGIGDAINFLGKPCGGEAGYSPDAQTDERGDLSTKSFQVLPIAPDGRIEIDVYRGTKKVYSANQNNEGAPLCVSPGRCLEVVLVFDSKTGVTVTVTVNPWTKNWHQETELQDHY